MVSPQKSQPYRCVWTAGKLRQFARSNRDLKGRNGELKSKLEEALRDQRRLVMEVQASSTLCSLGCCTLLQEGTPKEVVQGLLDAGEHLWVPPVYRESVPCLTCNDHCRWARHRGRDPGWALCASPSCSTCLLAKAGQKTAVRSHAVPALLPALAAQLHW